jgi:hypothetical protein
MFTLVIAQRLGFQSDLTLVFSILEGVCLTVALMLLVERYLFSTTSMSSRSGIGGPAGGPAVLAVAAEAAPAAGSSTQA